MIRGQINTQVHSTVCTYSAGTKQVQTSLLVVLLLSAHPWCLCGRKSGDRVPLASTRCCASPSFAAHFTHHPPLPLEEEVAGTSNLPRKVPNYGGAAIPMYRHCVLVVFTVFLAECF